MLMPLNCDPYYYYEYKMVLIYVFFPLTLPRKIVSKASRELNKTFSGHVSWDSQTSESEQQVTIPHNS